MGDQKQLKSSQLDTTSLRREETKIQPETTCMIMESGETDIEIQELQAGKQNTGSRIGRILSLVTLAVTWLFSCLMNFIFVFYCSAFVFYIAQLISYYMTGDIF